jgi:hypothetical protein
MLSKGVQYLNSLLPKPRNENVNYSRVKGFSHQRLFVLNNEFTLIDPNLKSKRALIRFTTKSLKGNSSDRQTFLRDLLGHNLLGPELLYSLISQTELLSDNEWDKIVDGTSTLTLLSGVTYQGKRCYIN